MSASVSYSSQVTTFVNNHKMLCVCTLGTAAVVYAVGVFLGRMVTWIKEKLGLVARTDAVAQRIINNPAPPPQMAERTFALPDGSVMRGRFLQDGSGHGSRTIQGAVYEGYFTANHQLQGEGTITFEDGTVFEGIFRENQLIRGKKIRAQDYIEFVHYTTQASYCDGEITYSNIFLNTQDAINLEDGSVMRGIFTDGNGFGKRTFSDGRIWEGEFKNFLLDGLGRQTLPGNAIQTGIFSGGFLKEGKKIWSDDYVEYVFENGEARFCNNRFEYSPEFRQNERTETAIDGSVFRGLFRKFKGVGTLTFPNGRVDEGEFRGDLNGKGKRTERNGLPVVGNFRRGAFCPEEIFID